jgi:hypothetical protein
MTILIAHTQNLFDLVDMSTTGHDLRLSKKTLGCKKFV